MFVKMGPVLFVMVRCIIAWLVLSFLLVPIIILNSLEGFGSQMAVVSVATIALILVLLLLSKAKMRELLVAGATYAALMKLLTFRVICGFLLRRSI